MKKLIVVVVSLFFCSCLSTRETQKTNERVRLIETGVIERKAQGDIIVLPMPQIPAERPKSVTKVYKGNQGATATVTYDEDGFLKDAIVICPEVSEKEKYDRDMDMKIKEKTTTREFNQLLVKEVKSTVLWVVVILSGAWVIRSVIKSIFS